MSTAVFKRAALIPALVRGLILVLAPLSAFYLSQFVYGADLGQLAPGIVLANALCIGALYYPLCAVTARPALSCVVLHLLLGLWGAANYFVSVYRGSPVLPWDLTALGTAAAVSGSYDFTPTWRMVLALVLIALLAAALVLLRRAGLLPLPRRRLPLRAGCLAAGLLCLIPVLRPQLLGDFGLPCIRQDRQYSV